MSSSDERRRALAAARSRRRYLHRKLRLDTISIPVNLDALRRTLREADWLKAGDPDGRRAIERVMQRVVAHWVGDEGEPHA